MDFGLASLPLPQPDLLEHGQDGLGTLRRAELGQDLGLLAQPGEAGQQVEITGGIGRGNGEQEDRVAPARNSSRPKRSAPACARTQIAAA